MWHSLKQQDLWPSTRKEKCLAGTSCIDFGHMGVWGCYVINSQMRHPPPSSSAISGTERNLSLSCNLIRDVSSGTPIQPQHVRALHILRATGIVFTSSRIQPACLGAHLVIWGSLGSSHKFWPPTSACQAGRNHAQKLRDE